jgi:hypothetical protein
VVAHLRNLFTALHDEHDIVSVVKHCVERKFYTDPTMLI